MGTMYNIHRDLKRERVVNNYSAKNRLIDSGIYNELKARKKCMYCGKKFNGQIPEIHHKIPISEGGTNDKNNLMAVHKKCHKILDEEYEKKV